jgi:hypothetical protein
VDQSENRDADRPKVGRGHALWDAVWGRYWRWVRAEEVASALSLPQRVSYQRTIVSAQIGIAAAVALIALLTWIQRPTTTVVPPHHIITLRDLYILEEARTVDGPYPGARPNVPQDERREGFLGFVNLSPQDDRCVPEPPTLVASDIYATAPDAIFDPLRVVSFSLEEGMFDTVVLPKGTSDRRTEPVTISDLSERPPCVVKKYDPPYPPGYLMSDSLIEGLVTLEVAVDDRGNMVRFVPVLPDGRTLDTVWYFVRAQMVRRGEVGLAGVRQFGPWEADSSACFAENVGWMLKFWTFGPALADGRPVSGDLNITYYFCLDYPDCADLTLEDVVREIGYSFHQVE